MTLPLAPGVPWPAALVAWGPGFRSEPHSHHSSQLVMTMGGTLRVRGGARGRWMTGGAAFVRSDVVHEVDATEGTTLIAFFDPESYLGMAFSDRVTVDIGLVAPAEVDAWRATLAAGLCSETVNAWLATLVEHPTHGLTIDSRIHTALAFLKENVANPRRVSLSAVAAHAGLSASRFMHLFTATVGVPLRPYILWLRLQVAAGELIRGATASRAAHRAGFSDSAHLTRTFRRNAWRHTVQARLWQARGKPGERST